MIISDLNHLEVVEAANVVGGGYGFSEYDTFNSRVNSSAYISGNVAESFGNAVAYGDDTYTKTVTSTAAYDDYGSASSSTSVSAVR